MRINIYYLKKLKQIFVIGIFWILASACNSKTGDPLKMPTVYVKESRDGFQLMRNGQPFYMKGGAAHSDYLVELKEAGANTARIYDTINLQKTLDLAHKLELAIVVDIPMPKFNNAPDYYENDRLFKRMKNRIERVVKSHKDHPALLYWNLGNELFYPYFYNNTRFHENFNVLIDLIHKIDPNHPVSTVTIGANKLRVLSIHRKSPDLDIISFNSFGTLSVFSKKLKPIAPIWKGPHVITEWGVNGPWEANLTVWKAPIEETSTKKAEQIRERYHNYIKPIAQKNSLGNFVFYWGKKNEVTPTWYSLFGEKKMKTEAVYELSKIWNPNKSLIYSGPKLDYILLNDQGAMESVFVNPKLPIKLNVVLPENYSQELEYEFEVRHESWFNFHESILVKGINYEKHKNSFIFNAPEEEGPYRLFVYLTNNTGYIATANIPFYVLTPTNGE